MSKSIVSLNERNFILESLRENKLRIDGRRNYDFRSLKLTFGENFNHSSTNRTTNQTGHVTVQLGTTRVIAIVSSEIVEPFPDRPTEGFFHFNVELSPMADPSFEARSHSSEFSIELGRVVERGLRESRSIDTEALCLVAGQQVWSIRVDIHIVDNGGNLIDCSSIATIAALLHFRRPFTTTIGNSVTVHSLEDREPVPLSIHHIPISITFGFFDDGKNIVVDPSLKEELVMDGRMTLTLNSHREICAVQKGGGTPLTVDQILQCTRIAAVKVEEITEILQQALKEATSSQSNSNRNSIRTSSTQKPTSI